MPRAVECELVEVRPTAAPQGPPVLFVHGVRHGAWCWRGWQDALAERGIGSWAVSLRGHGASGGTVTGATLRAYVDDIVWAAARLPAPPVLVGHSMGGLLVQRAVHRLPARGLVMLAPGPAHNGLMFALRFGRAHPLALLQVAAGRSLPFTRAALMSDAVPAAAAAAALAQLGRESALAQYQITLPRRPPARPSCPRLLIGTPDDAIIPVADVERCARLQDTPVHWYPGLGHDIMLEPGGLPALELLSSFVREL